MPTYRDDRDPDDPDEIVDMPRDRAGLPKVVAVLGVIVVLFAVLAVGVRSWYQRQLDPPGPPGQEVVVLIPSGSRLTDLGSLLDNSNIVANGTLFRFWVRDKDIDLQAGTYTFRRNMSFEEVTEVLEAGPDVVASESVTIPEGYRIDQMLDKVVEVVPRFSREELEAALADPANRSPFLPADQSAVPAGVPPMEGMLFPSTYEVGANDTPSTLIRRMVDQMVSEANEAGIANGLVGDNLPPLDGYQVLVVASLIERETGSNEESPKIARVIYNRILNGPANGIYGLGIDATSQYLADVTGQPFDLSVASPYNTSNSLTLPPTPIAAPGRASIEAALNPAPNPIDGGPLLYYVLEAPGQHFFTSSYEEFLEAKERCEQQDLGCG